MPENKIDKLAGLLKRLKAGDDPAAVKEEARRFLSSIDPKDLSLAEQKLLEAGLRPEDLRHLCSVHIEVLGGELKKIKLKLTPGHVLDTLIKEHEMILGFLDELEKVNQAIQQMETFNPSKEEFKKLKHIAEHLAAAEKHHQREEEVLFPEVEKKGVFGPPQMMMLEHKDLRRRKQALQELAEKVEQMDFPDFKKRLDNTSKFILAVLRDHIFKENNILYPTALEVIKDDQIWSKMKNKCDTIGYCCFTPEY